MEDFKSMYYHLAGRMATTIEVLEATNEILNSTASSLQSTAVSLSDLTAKLKLAQQKTEEMFISELREIEINPKD